MALKAIIDSVEGLPEALQEHYTEVDGKFRLNVEASNGWALEDVGGLKSALSAERKARREAASYLSLYGDYDDKSLEFTPTVDADEYGRLKKQVEKLKDAKPDEKAKAEREAWEKQVLEKHSGELESKDKELEQVNAQIRKLLITSKATAAISKHAPNAVDLLMPHVERATRIEKNGNGDYVVRVLDDNGNPAITRGEGTGDMDIAEYVDVVLRDKYPYAFPGSGATGSGATGTTGTSGGTGGPLYVSHTEIQNNPGRYRELKAQAEKEGRILTLRE